MAKAASPIRLQKELMQDAELTGRRFHRSTAEQIEYWSDLGRTLSSTINPDILLSVLSGLATIKIEPVFSSPIDPDAVFKTLENSRKDGSLQNTVTNSAVRYQASIKHPGYLEQINSDGNVKTGQFNNGQFIGLNELIT